jgi:hypothetical protein
LHRPRENCGAGEGDVGQGGFQHFVLFGRRDLIVEWQAQDSPPHCIISVVNHGRAMAVREVGRASVFALPTFLSRPFPLPPTRSNVNHKKFCQRLTL